jgi:phospholipase C
MSTMSPPTSRRFSSIEDNWSLGRIGGNSSDVKAGTLNGLFDFSDKNRAPKLILDDSTGTILQQN